MGGEEGVGVEWDMRFGCNVGAERRAERKGRFMIYDSSFSSRMDKWARAKSEVEGLVYTVYRV